MDDVMKDTALTENGDKIHSTTHNPCLDLFYTLDSVLKHKIKLLDEAWKQDPDLTLHIIFHARSIHLGKNRKASFFRAFCWLLKKHPKTAIRNLFMLAHGTIKSNVKRINTGKGETEDKDWDRLNGLKEEEPILKKSLGCWKDLAIIFTVYCQDELKAPVYRNYKALFWGHIARRQNWYAFEKKNEQDRKKRWKARAMMSEQDRIKDGQRCIELNKKQGEEQKAQAHENRVRLRKERNARVTYLMTEDPLYQALHVTVSRLFADQLILDMAQLEINRKKVEAGLDTRKYDISNHLSLAAKWAPSLRHSFDKHTFLATSIAEIMFPPSKYQDETETRERYLQKVRNLYRKQCLIPLCEALDLTERRMAPGLWKTIDYHHVPSVCLRQNIGQFYQHNPDEVLAYTKFIKEGKRKVNGSTLTPNLLVYKALNPDIPKLEEYVESENIPIYAAIGLSLLISNLAKPPFHGRVISFTNIPSFLSPSTDLSLTEQVKMIKESVIGNRISLRAVFTSLLLPMAKRYNLCREDLVKRIFIFSDIEFDGGITKPNKLSTTYESIREEYKKAGYDVPELVWWNLAERAQVKAAVTKAHEGVYVISGFSASMMKAFFNGELEEEKNEDKDGDVDEASEKINRKMNLFNDMKKLVYHESFADLKVLD